MKASELITKLQEEIRKYGDQPLCIREPFSFDEYEVTHVAYRREEFLITNRIVIEISL